MQNWKRTQESCRVAKTYNGMQQNFTGHDTHIEWSAWLRRRVCYPVDNVWMNRMRLQPSPLCTQNMTEGTIFVFNSSDMSFFGQLFLGGVIKHCDCVSEIHPKFHPKKVACNHVGFQSFISSWYIAWELMPISSPVRTFDFNPKKNTKNMSRLPRSMAKTVTPKVSID